MDPSATLEAIFLRAREIISPKERAAYLDQACAGAAKLRAEVERLLLAQAKVGNFLEPGHSPPTEFHERLPPAEMPGSRIGPYKLLQQIGEGGMGTVFMAEQIEPVKRLVALKVIKAGMDISQVIARFEAERQALALMDHPNIAKVLDAGTTASGRPYFVMELVKGIPITKYCDEHRLGPRQRLELFVPVCQAVQHAHQKGIIHRDLKPSNVMVAQYDGRPVPKVIDFGVAKAAGQKLTERTLFTGFGAFVGTLEYMSPEQAELNQLDIDTRSDIYSLGVLLYELLTGSTPLDRKRLHDGALLEALRMIREEEPPKPSTRLSTSQTLPALSAQRQMEPARLTKLMRGELDWIVMKALEKDRNRRYETANGLARDVEHYLKDELVEARPPSLGYRLRKSVRKNRGPVIAASLVFMALLAGVIGTTAAMWRAWDAEEKTRDARDTIQANLVVVEGLTEKALKARDEAEVQRQQAEQGQKAAEAERNVAQRERARLALERGISLLELQNDASRGFLWLGRSLKLAPPGAEDLQRAAWANLSAWRPRIHAVRYCVTPDMPNLGTVEAHETGGVFVLAYRPDGRLFAVGTQDARIRFYAAADGKLLWTSPPHVAAVRGLAFTPDGHILVAGCGKRWREKEGEVRLWKVSDDGQAEPLGQPIAHPAPVWGVAVHPGGKRFVTACLDKQVRQYDLDSRQLFGSPLPCPQPVAAVTYSPDGKWLAAGTSQTDNWSGSGHVLVFDANTGQANGIKIASQGVMTLAYSPDGTLLATGSRSLNVHVLQASTGRSLFRVTHSVFDFAFSPDGRTLLTCGSDWKAKLWNVPGGTAIGQPLSCNAGWINAVAFHPDGRSFLTGDSRSVRAWELAGQLRPYEEVLRLSAKVHKYALSADGTVIVARTEDNAGQRHVRLWSLTSGQPLGPPLADSGGTYDALAIGGPDNAIVVAGDNRPDVPVLHGISGKELCKLKHPKAVNGAAISPDGRWVMTGCSDYKARVFELATGKLQWEWEQDNLVGDVTFSPDSKTALTNNWSSAAYLYDVASGQPLHTRIGVGLGCQVFSADGRSFAAAITHGDYTARIFDTAGGKSVSPALEHPSGITSLAFSLDGHMLATATWEKKVRLWDSKTGGRLGPTLDCPEQIRLVRFTADGAGLLTADANGSVRRWSLPAPVHGEAERLTQWTEVLTGMTLDEHGVVRSLREASWRKLEQGLRELGGPPEPGLKPAALTRAWHLAQAEDNEQARHWFAAAWHLDRLIALEPKNRAFYARRGRTFAERNQWKEAAADYGRAVEGKDPHNKPWLEYALTLLKCDDLTAYRLLCADLVDWYGQTDDPELAGRAARICQLAPGSVADLKLPVRLAELAVKNAAKNPNLRHVLGANLHRAGQHEEALKHLQQALKDRGKDGAIQDWLYLALASAAAGKRLEAQKWLDQAQSWLDMKSPPTPAPTWQNRLEWQILFEQARLGFKARGDDK